MNHHYLLSATGEDKPGIVAAISEILFRWGCNLEDSAMMRLGSEFGVLLIFSSEKEIQKKKSTDFSNALKRRYQLTVDLKKISSAQAKFIPASKNLFLITVHGPDKPGIVFRVTRMLAAHRFNITDLATHRTQGKKAGYILFIEGELKSVSKLSRLKRAFAQLSASSKTSILIKPIVTHHF